MDTSMSDRILAIISARGINKTEFAAKLNISQAYVSQMCSGVRNPSDRTLSDICREFFINEHWLRTGEGAMLKPMNRDQEIAAFMGDVMARESDDFRKRLMAVLAKLDVAEWELLEKMALKLAAESKKEDQAET